MFIYSFLHCYMCYWSSTTVDVPFRHIRPKCLIFTCIKIASCHLAQSGPFKFTERVFCPPTDLQNGHLWNENQICAQTNLQTLLCTIKIIGCRLQQVKTGYFSDKKDDSQISKKRSLDTYSCRQAVQVLSGLALVNSWLHQPPGWMCPCLHWSHCVQIRRNLPQSQHSDVRGLSQ